MSDPQSGGYHTTVRRPAESETWDLCPGCGEQMNSYGYPEGSDGEVFECRNDDCDEDGEIWVRPEATA